MKTLEQSEFEKLWAKDRKSYFALHPSSDGIVRLKKFIERHDDEEDVTYWIESLGEDYGIFGDRSLTRNEARRLMGSETK